MVVDVATANQSDIEGTMRQGCQLSRNAWREEPKHKKE